MNAARPSAIVFDMDGTLADSIGYYYDVSCEITDLVGAPRPTREHVYELMGRGAPDLVRRLLPDDFPDPEAALLRVRGHFRDRQTFRRPFEPLPGTLDVVRDLHRAGHPLGIATSGNRELPSLDVWGVRSLFGAIVGREDVERRKPHPEPIHRTVALLGVSAEETIYVGDSEIDMEAARRAEVTPVGVLTGTTGQERLQAAGAEIVLGSAAELPEVLAELSRGLSSPRADPR